MSIMKKGLRKVGTTVHGFDVYVDRYQPEGEILSNCDGTWVIVHPDNPLLEYIEIDDDKETNKEEDTEIK